MKTLPLFFFVFFITNLTAQNGWFWQNPKPQGNDLISVFFITPNIGWVTGTAGTILWTSDGGLRWTIQQSNVNVTLRSIYFVNESIGWICGSYGTILKTKDGGVHWVIQQSGSNYSLQSIIFINESTGWSAGLGGTIIKTTDG
jgi:photosystem II stability/assembly factor-like uncharacterized protein